MVESIKFIKEKGKSLKRIKFYGQENRMTLFQLCCMHLALYGIDIKHMKWHSDMSINMDKHRDLKADFILCGPPYNSPVLPWIYYILSHLSREGCAAVLIAKDSLFVEKGKGNRIHKELIRTNFVDCIVNLPDKLFPMAGGSLSILILAMDRVLKKCRHRYRKDEILLIDAAALPSMKMIDNKDFTIFDINKIVDTYHKWREKQSKAMDNKSFFKTININS
jgi:type I restriction enzyme M protein